MKQHLIAYLETRPEDELAKILSWAITQGRRLDDRTPYENRALDTAMSAQYKLEQK